jgi:hypothetical protein
MRDFLREQIDPPTAILLALVVVLGLACTIAQIAMGVARWLN